MSEVDQIIVDFLQDTPPGETKNVINDLKLILNEPSIANKITAALEESFTSESSDSFEVIQLPGEDIEKYSIISKHNFKGSKFYDSQANKLFHVQFLENKPIDIEDSTETEEDQERSEDFLSLVNSLKTYVSEHYPTDSQKKIAYDVVQTSPEETLIVFINTKANSTNFVNGKWLSHYKYNKTANTLSGKILVDIHYFEDGNVRLKTGKAVEAQEIKTASSSSAGGVIATIKALEEDFEKKLNQKFLKLNEVEFKSLRRQLPVTRSKINWGRAIGNYRLGKDVNSLA